MSSDLPEELIVFREKESVLVRMENEVFDTPIQKFKIENFEQETREKCPYETDCGKSGCELNYKTCKTCIDYLTKW